MKITKTIVTAMMTLLFAQPAMATYHNPTLDTSAIFHTAWNRAVADLNPRILPDVSENESVNDSEQSETTEYNFNKNDVILIENIFPSEIQEHKFLPFHYELKDDGSYIIFGMLQITTSQNEDKQDSNFVSLEKAKCFNFVNKWNKVMEGEYLSQETFFKAYPLKSKRTPFDFKVQNSCEYLDGAI